MQSDGCSVARCSIMLSGSFSGLGTMEGTAMPNFKCLSLLLASFAFSSHLGYLRLSMIRHELVTAVLLILKRV